MSCPLPRFRLGSELALNSDSAADHAMDAPNGDPAFALSPNTAWGAVLALGKPNLPAEKAILEAVAVAS